jgi:hypothetical protein
MMAGIPVPRIRPASSKALDYSAHQMAAVRHGEALGPNPFAACSLAGEDQPERVLQKVSQETLAEMIGTTRTRVNLFMNKFRNLGFVRYNGEIKVNKSLLTVVLH